MTDATALDVARFLGITSGPPWCPSLDCCRDAGHRGRCVSAEVLKSLLRSPSATEGDGVEVSSVTTEAKGSHV